MESVLWEWLSMAGDILLEALGVYSSTGELLGDSVLVRNGSIVRVGVGVDIASARRVRIGGYLLPPLVDAHLHLESTGLARSSVDLSGAKSPEDVGRMLAGSPGPVALGRGWNQEEFEDSRRLPTRKVLDHYVPDRPALAVRVCGHMAVANSLLLRMVGFEGLKPGLVDLERGLLFEDAVYRSLEVVRGIFSAKDLVVRASKMLSEAGIWGVSSMACSGSEMSALKSVGDNLAVRVSCYASLSEYRRLAGPIGGVRWGVVGVKLFSDGSLGARTALLRSPYSDDPATSGVELLGAREIERLATEFTARGFRTSIHAIGDKALDNVLEGLEKAVSAGARPEDLRVEHASIAWDEQISRLSRLGVWVVVQPRFRVSDWWVDRRLGPERASRVYPFRTMMSAGARLALSSDSPVEPFDPSETFKAAIGLCNGPACNPSESLSPKDTIKLYTENSALASAGPVAVLSRGLDRESPAVFTASNKDPFNSTRKELQEIKFWGVGLERDWTGLASGF